MQEKLSNGSVRLFRLDLKKVMKKLRNYAKEKVKEGAVAVILKVL